MPADTREFNVMRSSRSIVSVLTGLVLSVALAIPACNEGGEGDRCNPLLSHDECGGTSLVCSGPGTSHPLPGNCVENYCCPPNAMSSTNPECNGTDPVCGVMPDSGGADTGAEPVDGGAG